MTVHNELKYLSNLVPEIYLHPLRVSKFNEAGDVVERSERYDVQAKLKSISSSVKEKVADVIVKYPAETVGLGSGIFTGLFVESSAHLNPQWYAELYSQFAPGEVTLILVLGGAAAALIYRGLNWLYRKHTTRKSKI